MGIPISVLIHTLNEEKNIRNCLECVKWADDIVIIDMYSEDNTVTIAREYTDRIYMHKRVRYVEPARQFGLQQTRNDWVLVVDADELVSKSLRDRLIEIMNSNQYDAVKIPHKNYFFGYAMQGTGWGALQDKHIRFFKKKYMSYGNRIHGSPLLSNEARVYDLNDEECSFIHFNYLDVEHFLEKLNRYTTIEAENNWDAGDPINKPRILRRMFREIWKRFIKMKGYRDGFQGFVLAWLMASYQASSALKHYLMQKYHTKNIRSEILRKYDELAREELKKYLDSIN